MARFTFELPDSLKRNIELEAEREHRSTGSQIVHLLESHFSEEKSVDVEEAK